MFLFDGAILQLSDQVPGSVAIEATVSQQTKFTQWHFGDSQSTPVAVLLDEGEDRLHLFIDSNRDRVIDDSEIVTTTILGGTTWIAELNAQVLTDDVQSNASRQIAISRTKSLDSLRISTLGYASGTAQVDDRTISFRRMDLDGNGLPLDGGDIVLIDLNDDGAFDELDEQFGLSSDLTIEGMRYRLRSDQLGHGLQLSRIDNSAKVRFLLTLDDAKSTLDRVEGLMLDEQGFVVPIKLTETPVSIPAGRYCIDSLTVVAKDPSGKIWHMLLERASTQGWFDLQKDESKQISLLDQLKIDVVLVKQRTSLGQIQTVAQPKVQSQHGLVMTDFTCLGTGEYKQHPAVADRTAAKLSIARPGEKAAPAVVCSKFG